MNVWSKTQDSSSPRCALLRASRTAAALVVFAAVSAWCPIPDAAADTASGPYELVREQTERLLAAVKTEEATIRGDNPSRAAALVEEILFPYVDFERIGRLVLGVHWRDASAEQRARFMEELRTLQLRTYAVALTEYTDVRITYLPPRPAGRENEAMVRTQVPRKGGVPVGIDYRLHSRDGDWKVYDVIVDGVSLVSVFRTSVGAEIKRDGIDEVIRRLAHSNRGKSGDP